jgi:hypothetical protein
MPLLDSSFRFANYFSSPAVIGQVEKPGAPARRNASRGAARMVPVREFGKIPAAAGSPSPRGETVDIDRAEAAA